MSCTFSFMLPVMLLVGPKGQNATCYHHLGVSPQPGFPGCHWYPRDFMGSLGFHVIPGIGISCNPWDSQAASQVQGAGGRER